MTLDDAQRKKVAEWIAAGQKLSEIQNQLASELGVRMTYMDVRLLVDDLKLTPKDVELPKTAPVLPAANAKGGPAKVPESAAARSLDQKTAPAPSGTRGVSVSVDQLTKPGAMVSGKVTFNDGNSANWYIDQTGRLGVVPDQQGYRPPQADLQQFQAALETELSKLGF
jgi:hypothetical protein